MIRLPPTTIVLGRGDLREFERRRQRRRDVEILDQEYSRLTVGAPDGPKLQIQHAQEVAFGVEGQKLRTGDGGQNADLEDQHYSLQTGAPISVQTASKLEHTASGAPASPKSSSTTEDEFPSITDLQDEYGYVCVASKNPAHDSQRSPSPSNDDFYYGGFVESQSYRTSDNTPNRSSFFALDDISTPQSVQLPDTNRFRSRVPLPRSPLFLSHNASSSPEHRPTSGLTPRVASRMVTHNTPGIMFAQPARRLRRRPQPRAFRHQTNSFSFDSSERASAAYEQDRVSSRSTDDGIARPSDDISLHEELRGSSLQSSRVTSGVTSGVTSRISYAIPDPLVEDFSTVRIRDESDEAVATERESIFSSPQLSLPPPFSTVPRNVSGAGSLPGVEHIPHNPATSPIRSSSNTPVTSGVAGRRPSPNLSRSILEHVGEVGSSPPLADGTIPRSLIGRAADTVVDFYRSRTPLNRHGSPNHPSPSPSPSTSPTPRRGQSRPSSTEVRPTTPSRAYQVYNDSLPRSSQAQTPAHLPEARHQSRFHSSYTAPVTRGAARRAVPPVNRADRGNREGPGLLWLQQLSTPLRRAGRSASPLGMLQDGFTGLYGGRENGDEEHNWAEGVRFSYAETRLWGLRDARNDGTSLRETPEPEDWRVGRRD